ncbi:hypothetical protein [Saccharopolyspora sp. ASAGF58]|uniref:hypothetical protein n=1 Tax=Saccharopolyspora sp. ASAGF58 TaxID=2719023 RepID=UPI0014479853|nr:hypothetical protein [Saccharopolyspora sp. ASAGF58]
MQPLWELFRRHHGACALCPQPNTWYSSTAQPARPPRGLDPDVRQEVAAALEALDVWA